MLLFCDIYFSLGLSLNEQLVKWLFNEHQGRKYKKQNQINPFDATRA